MNPNRIILFLLLQIVGITIYSQEKPTNILFCFGDDWGYYASCFADPGNAGVNDCVNTPGIDQLAKEGVSFNHAYVNAPSCTPSRASVATGCYFWRTGSTANLMGGSWEGEEDPGSKLPGFGHLLLEKGYHLGRTYKTLADQWFPGKIYHDSVRSFCEYSQTVEAAESMEKGHALLKQEVITNFQDFLNDRKEGQAFCYVWGPHNPHRPWNKGSGKNIWGIDPEDLRGKMPGYLPDVPEVREDFADYLGEVQAFDNGVQYLVEELKRIGEYENTLIVLSGDNGIPGFSRGKCNLYDFGVRTPLIIRWGEIQYSNRKVDDFTSLIDLAPTFLEAAGIKSPGTMDGKSLMPQLISNKEGLIDKERMYAVVGRERHNPVARDGNLPYPSRAIHTKDFIYIINFKPEREPVGTDKGMFSKVPQPTYDFLQEYGNPLNPKMFADFGSGPTKAFLVANRNSPEYEKFYEMAFGKRPREELYDLKKDPDQIENVADDKRYAKVKAKLSAQLMEVLENTDDPRLNDAFDFPPYMEQ